MEKIFVLVVLLSVEAFAQFKPTANEQQPRVSDSFIQPQSASEWFSLFNPNNFSMRHSYSASYTTSGGQGLALQRYTNTMMYQFAPNLDARVDISLQNSPYSTFESRLQSQFNKIYLSNAELNYRPWDNTLIRLSYRQYPGGYYPYGYYSPYRSTFSDFDYHEGN